MLLNLCASGNDHFWQINDKSSRFLKHFHINFKLLHYYPPLSSQRVFWRGWWSLGIVCSVCRGGDGCSVWTADSTWEPTLNPGAWPTTWPLRSEEVWGGVLDQGHTKKQREIAREGGCLLLCEQQCRKYSSCLFMMEPGEFSWVLTIVIPVVSFVYLHFFACNYSSQVWQRFSLLLV